MIKIYFKTDLRQNMVQEKVMTLDEFESFKKDVYVFGIQISIFDYIN